GARLTVRAGPAFRASQPRKRLFFDRILRRPRGARGDFQSPPTTHMLNLQLLSRRFLFVFALALLALASMVASQARSSPLAQEKHDKQGKHEKQDDEDTPLERAMQALQGSQKKLDKALAAKDLATALPLVLDMQRATIAARVETPPRAAEISDGAKRAEFV